MANTTFNTRIKLKYDSLANWTSANPILLKGEIAVVEVPNAVDPIRNAPSILMKAGDGSTAFTELKYLSGLAGDVYSWAKAATKPSYSASEIEGLSDYISGEIQDTDTQYKIDFADGKVRLFSKKLEDAAFGTTAVAEAEIPTYALATGSAKGTVAFNGTDVAVKGLGSAAFVDSTTFDAAGAADTAETNAKAYAVGLASNYDAAGAADGVKTALEGKIGTVTEGKTVVGMIADAQAAATYDDTALAGRVKTLEDDTRLATLVGSDANKSARTIANEELTKQLIPENAKESLNTLQEIAAWIQAHPDDASAMSGKISALETKVGNSSVADQISSAITDLDLDNTYDAKGAAGTAETNAKAYAVGLASNYDAAGAAGTAKTEAIAAAKEAADAAYVAKETGKGLSANDFTDALKTKVEGIEEGAQVNVIESIEVNGVAATVANKKATVAVSLDQINANTAENYVIFDCGSASTLV